MRLTTYTLGIRRICPGVNFTDASIFIWCAMILSVYDISKAVGFDGTFVEPDGEYTSGALRYVYFSKIMREFDDSNW